MRTLEALMKRWSPKWAQPRHVQYVSLATVFLLLSLGAFLTIAFFPHTFAALAGVVVGYPKYIRLTNAILALICAAFLLWPREGGRLVGRWNDYIGLAFFTFFVQYVWRFAAILVTPSGYAFLDMVITAVTYVVVFLASFLNNLFFLAAARILLNKNRKTPETTPPPGVYARFKYHSAKLMAALPGWQPVWFLFVLLVSFLPLLEEVAKPYLLWVRFPDAVFSIFCLSWFAYAIFLSFNVRRRKTLAWMGFVLVIAYAAGQLVFAANPFFAYLYSKKEQTRPSYLPTTWIRDRLKPAVDEVLADKSKAISEKNATPLQIFDGAIFAILAPMKYLLFLPPFILYLLAIISTNDFRGALRETTSKRKDYLSGDGILSAIGRSLGADEVKLLIRIPGVKRRQGMKEERALVKAWRAPGVVGDEKAPKIFPLDDDRLLARALQTRGEVIVVTDADHRGDVAELRVSGASPQTVALIPIKFHGGVIGALRGVFRGYGKYNDGTLEQLKFMAELVAPSVQDFRTVAAVDKLGPRLNHIHGGNPPDSFRDAIDKMVETLYDLLSPLSIGLIIESGFTSLKPIYPAEGVYYEILNNFKVGHRGESPRPVETEVGPIKVEPDQLYFITDKGTRYNLGSLILAIPRDSDELTRPTLAAHYLTRRMLASLIADGISNAARNSLSIVIQDLSVALDKETLSVKEWFDEIQTAIKKIGLLWAATSGGVDEALRGRREHVEILNGLAAADKERLFGESPSSVPCPSPESATRHVIHLKLDKSGHRLWLGVERSGFGGELSFESPWRVFLESLADVADTALARIADREKAEARVYLDSKKRTMLKSISDLCLYLGHDQQGIIEGGIARQDLREGSTSHQELARMAEDLWQTGMTLSSAANSPVNDDSPILDMGKMIKSAFADSRDVIPCDEIAFEVEGSCRVKAGHSDMYIAVKRLLQWLAQRCTETPPDIVPRINVRCVEREDGALITFEDRSRRLSQKSREHLFDPFATSVIPPTDTGERGPGLYLPLYTAKILVEEKYGGRLADESNEMEGDIGHRLVMHFESRGKQSDKHDAA